MRKELFVQTQILSAGNLLEIVSFILTEAGENILNISAGENLGVSIESFKTMCPALAGVAQWVKHGLRTRVTSSIPCQGTCLGCRPGPQWGPHEKQPHIDVFLPLPPFPPM